MGLMAAGCAVCTLLVLVLEAAWLMCACEGWIGDMVLRLHLDGE